MEKNSNFLIEIDETHLNEIEDVYNSNIEVFVTLQDGFLLTIIVGTLQNLQYLMEKDNVNFYGPGFPWIIVQKLTKEIIQEAIKAYIDDKWLKLYHFAPDIDIAVFNQLQAQEIQESAQFNLLVGLDDLKDKINKLDNLDKSNLVASLDKLYKHVSILS
jgi:predicted DNA-binding protein